MAKLFCTQCGAALDEGVKFCTSCGASVEPVAVPTQAPVSPAPEEVSAVVEQVVESVEAEAAAPIPEKEPAMATVSAPAAPSAHTPAPAAPAASVPPAVERPAAPPTPPVQPAQPRPVVQQAPVQPQPRPVPQHPPVQRPVTPQQSVPGGKNRYELMSTWGTFGALLLMCIPGIGLILTIAWACGGCRKYAKRNMARAFLLMLAVCFVLALIALLLARFVFMDQITTWFESVFPGYTIDWVF